MAIKSLVSVFLLAAATVNAAVTVLTPDNFDSLVDGSVPAFVEFYAPWCGHCKSLEPEYNTVGDTFKAADGVIVGKVDADAHRELASRFGVSGYPTLKWFPKGSTEPEDYSLGRTADDIVGFINEKTGLRRKVKSVPSAVPALTASSFDSIVMDPKVHALVEFYAPWCGHCKNLAPVWEKLGETYAGEESVVIAKVDADKHRDLASRYGVSGFPTIKYFAAGDNKEAQDYDGSRGGEDFVSFMNAKAGTFRTFGGGLNAEAGRIESLDLIAGRFLEASDKSALQKEAADASEGLEGEQARWARFYTKIMDKIVANGEGFVKTEKARLAKLLDSESVSPKKKSLFMLRTNVLEAFSNDE